MFHEERNWNYLSLNTLLHSPCVVSYYEDVNRSLFISLVLQSGNVPNSLGVDKAEKKLQENEDLMKRLTGMWEDKWSKTQKLIEVKGRKGS